MKILRNIFLGFIICLVLLVMARNILIRIGLEQGIRAVTGLGLKIQNLDIGILKPVISIKGLELYNPSSFPEKTMVDIPEVYVEYNLAELIKGKAHLKEVRFQLSQLTVVKNKDGKLNLDALTALKPPEGGGKPPELAIDDLTVKIGRVSYKDYTQEPYPSVKEFDVNIDEHYTDIKNPVDLVKLVVVRALTKTSIANLADLDLKSLKADLPGALLKSLQSSDSPVKGLLDNVSQKLQKLSF